MSAKGRESDIFDRRDYGFGEPRGGQYFPPGASLKRDADCSEELFLLHKGLAAVCRRDNEGMDRVVDVVGPGEFLRLGSVAEKDGNSEMIVTLCPCLVSSTSATALSAQLSSDNTLAITLLRSLCRRLDRLEEYLESPV